jgi:uncharacterized protein (DUF4415 family)
MTKRRDRPKPPADYDDNPPLTAAQIRRMRPASEVVPEIVAEYKRRGRPADGDKPKVPVSLRLDPDVLTAYKATGEGWQRRINDTLAKGAAKLKAKA